MDATQHHDTFALALANPILRRVIDNVRVKRRVFAGVECFLFHLNGTIQCILRA